MRNRDGIDIPRPTHAEWDGLTRTMTIWLDIYNADKELCPPDRTPQKQTLVLKLNINLIIYVKNSDFKDLHKFFPFRANFPFISMIWKYTFL